VRHGDAELSRIAVAASDATSLTALLRALDEDDD
jgi:hypothetical protein